MDNDEFDHFLNELVGDTGDEFSQFLADESIQNGVESPTVGQPNIYPPPNTFFSFPNQHLQEQQQAIPTGVGESKQEDFTAAPLQGENFIQQPPNITKPPPEVIEEILFLISWWPSESRVDSVDPNKPKPKLSKEQQQFKHRSVQKKRRDCMNDLIFRLKYILPIKPDSKMTKLTILSESVEYMGRLQNLCAHLLQENKLLKSQFQSVNQAPPDHKNEPPTKKTKTELGNNWSTSNGSKVFLFSVFFLLFFLVPQKTLLDDNPGVGLMYEKQTFVQYICNMFRVCFFAIVTFTLLCIVSETKSIPENPLQRANEQVCKGEMESGIGHKDKAFHHFRSALISLRLTIPNSSPMLYLLLIYQIFRFLFHRCYFGLWIERTLNKFQPVNQKYAIAICNAVVPFLKEYDDPDYSWMYLALKTVNFANTLNLSSQRQEIEATSINKVSKDSPVLLRLFTICLEWDLINNDTEHKSFLYLENYISSIKKEGVYEAINGRFEHAKIIFNLALKLSCRLGSRRDVVREKISANIATILLLENNWSRCLTIFGRLCRTMIRSEICQTNIPYWDIFGVIISLERLSKMDEAQLVLKVYEKNYKTEDSDDIEQSVWKSVKADILIRKKDWVQAFRVAKEGLTLLVKQTNLKNNVQFLVSPYLVLFVNHFLCLWEESFKVSSPIHDKNQSLNRLVEESFTLLHKLSNSFPFMQQLIVAFESKRQKFLLQHQSNVQSE